MLTLYQRAVRAMGQHHRCITVKNSSFCICGEPGTEWDTNTPMYWVGWNEHVQAKVKEAMNKLDVK